MTSTAPSRPNILIIMADQMTAALSGAYGHPVVKTPALDQLCREGVRFDAGYTNCPVCAPARAAMLSGRYVSRTRSYDNAGCLPSDVPCFPHYLRLAGYECVGAGKFHFIGADQLHGFERRLTTDIYPSDFSWTCHNDHALEMQEMKAAGQWPDLPKWGKWVQIPEAGPCDSNFQTEYDEETQFRALQFLRGKAPNRGVESEYLPEELLRHGQDKPFCLMVSYSHPHTPYLPPKKYWDMYEGVDLQIPPVPEDAQSQYCEMDKWLHSLEGVPRKLIDDPEQMQRLYRAYYAMITYVDDKVGQLLNTLDEFGLRDNTAIFFTADHGDMLGQKELVEKRVFYQWSAQIPYIASFPKAWQQGVTSDAPVSLIDLLPTLVELTGAPEPLNIDGTSFLGVLTGEDSGQDRVAISEFHSEGILSPCFLVRRGQYKYTYIHGYPGKLVDLAADPDESVNLIGQPEYEDLEASLRQEIFDRFDPAMIAEDVLLAQNEHRLIRDAMLQGQRTSWDYQPVYDAANRWLRK